MSNLLLQRDDIVRIENAIGDHVVLNVFANGEMATIAELSPDGIAAPYGSAYATAGLALLGHLEHESEEAR
ncbi:hypothetical protein [Agromyces bauzanensis]